MVKHGETLKIIECPEDPKKFLNLIRDERNKEKILVIMKIGARWIWVKKILEKENIINKSLLAINIGMKNQFIDKASKKNSEELPYFSLLLLRF